MITEDLDKYCVCMEEIKLRTTAISKVLQKKCTTPYQATNIEFLCLQIKKILELIALGSLVANKDEYARQHQKFAEHWNAARILKDIENINPRFYPHPIEQIIDPQTNKVKDIREITEGYLTHAEFPDVYDKCSAALHATNPFGDPIDYPSLEKCIPAWNSKIIVLLNHHRIQLLNEKEQLWVLMQANTDGKVHAYVFERIEEQIQEIQEKAQQVCQATHRSGTMYEAPGAEIYEAAKALSPFDINSMHKSSSRIARQLKKCCKGLSEKEKASICEVVEEIEHELDLSEKLSKIELALSYLSPILESHRPRLVDIVVLTVLPEEYKAICTQLSSFNPLGPPPNMGSNPNIYAWQSARVPCLKFNGAYNVAVGMIVKAGNSQSALAVKEAISLWQPNYLIFSGIAGGLSDPIEINTSLKKGDVIIAECIYGYEYGKIEKDFKPRGNWTYKTDQGLLTGAIAYALQTNWPERIKIKPTNEYAPIAISGEIASGEKVVDDPTSEFFNQVLEMWPKVKAVEMEGAGIGSAIEQAQSLKIPVGFMVIRSISDLPRPKGKGDKTRGTEERDAWKDYASSAAAAFTVGWIANGLPLPPSAEKFRHY